MSRSFDLGEVSRITVGAVGPPGRRAFFVQASTSFDHVTVLVEKEQVAVLARAVIQLLASLPETPEGAEPSDDDLELREPLDPAWRAGEMSISYDENVDRVGLELRELLDEDADEAEQGSARFIATRAQCRGLAGHALSVVNAGRPRCQLCGAPIEGEHHFCVSLNGHRPHVGDDDDEE